MLDIQIRRSIVIYIIISKECGAKYGGNQGEIQKHLKEEIQISMIEITEEMQIVKEEIQKSMTENKEEKKLLQDLPKRDMEIHKNHGCKEKHGIVTQSHVGGILSQLKNTNIE